MPKRHLFFRGSCQRGHRPPFGSPISVMQRASPSLTSDACRLIVRRSEVSLRIALTADAAHPQFLHHRAHRPRQVHARRPVHPALRGALGPRDERAGARFHGSRARARHHDQGPDGGVALHGARRQDLQPEPDRHARPRRLLLRGVALARGVRGRVARGRRLAGRRGANGRELLYRDRAGRGGRSGPEQDRPAVREPGAGDPGNRGCDRHSRAGRHPRQREDRRGHRRCPRGGDPAHPGAQGRSGCAAQGAHHRLLVRQLRRGRDAGAHGRRDATAEGSHPADVDAGKPSVRAGGRVYAQVREPP